MRCKQVLFVHGGGDGAYQADGALVAGVQHHLGRAYHVRYPRMPDEADPSYARWTPTLHRELAALADDAVVVGHSIGGYLLLRYLAEHPPFPAHVAGLCIAAAPFPAGDPNWQFADFTLPDGFGLRFPTQLPIFLYHATDDRTVPYAHMALYAQAIPRASAREVGGGHQLEGSLHVVADDIRRCLE
jgi:predicted alpha/beta hydrolase family esterase